jgi:hypothetical protein
VVALEQGMVDEVPAEHREVGMVAREQLVDLALRVAALRLEALGEPA